MPTSTLNNNDENKRESKTRSYANKIKVDRKKLSPEEALAQLKASVMQKQQQPIINSRPKSRPKSTLDSIPEEDSSPEI